MAIDRLSEVKRARRVLRSAARARWQEFNTPTKTQAGARPNRDGTFPKTVIAAPTSEQIGRYEAREVKREAFAGPHYRSLRVALERRIGATLDFSDLPPSEQALKAGRPVARLVSLGRNGLEPQGFATGFLVAPDLLITNWHVFRAADEADNVGAQFLYERVQDGIRSGLIFELDRRRFFLNHKDLDYAVVAVKPKSVTGADLTQFQFLPLIAAKGKILKGDPVNIIQHPDGRPKQYATINNKLLDLRDDGFLLYETDTLEGASGSPVLSQHWEVVGLHHCGVPQVEGGLLVARDGRRLPLDAEVDDDELVWIANEGVRVSAIVSSLAAQRVEGAGQSEILEKLLATTRDPTVLVEESSPLIVPIGEGTNTVPTIGEHGMAQNVFYVTGPVTVTFVGSAGRGEAPTGGNPGAGTSSGAAVFAGAGVAVALEKKLRFDEDYRSRDGLGYDSEFLDGWSVPTPGLLDPDVAIREGGGGSPVWIIPYYHFSLVMHRTRRLLIWAASNVDYSRGARRYTKKREEYGSEGWRLDPRVAMREPGLQLEDSHFYKPATAIDRGHIVRREDAAWGRNAKEAEFGNSDTFHWTNCTPQHDAFNQSGRYGIWGEFENHIQAEIAPIGGRMNVFAGPVLNPNDEWYGYDEDNMIQVPMEFWKVVVCAAAEAGQTKRFAYGFVFDQSGQVKRLGYERMNMDDYEIHQRRLSYITNRTGVAFDQSVLDADVMRQPRGAVENVGGDDAKRITSLESIILR